MAEQLSDPELLDSSANILEENTDYKTTHISSPTQETDTQNDNHDKENGTSDIQQTPEPRERKRQRIRDKSRNTRRTLRNLDHKLDKIHHDLAQVSRSQWRNESQQRPRPPIGRKLLYKPPLTYELTPAAARVVFRILNPNCIQWLHVDQKNYHQSTTKLRSQTTLERLAWPSHVDTSSRPRLRKIFTYTRSSCHPNARRAILLHASTSLT